MTFRFSNPASSDMRSAALWYARQRPGLEQFFLAAVTDTIGRIEANPLRFGRVKRMPAGHDVHQAMVRRFPYRLVYEIRDSEIMLLAVAHFSRREGFWRKRRE